MELKTKFFACAFATTMGLCLFFTACSKKDAASSPSIPEGAKMDAFNARMGTVLGKNLNQSYSVSTGVDPSNVDNTAVSSLFDSVKLGLSFDGGFSNTGVNHQKGSDLGAGFCARLVAIEAATPFSSEKRTGGVDLTTGFGTLTGSTWSLFGLALQRGWLKNMTYNLTGEPATDAGINVLLGAIPTYISNVTNDAAGKQVVVMLTCMTILSVNSSFY